MMTMIYRNGKMLKLTAGFYVLALVFALEDSAVAAKDIPKVAREVVSVDAPRKGDHRIFRRAPGPGNQVRVSQIETLLRAHVGIGTVQKVKEKKNRLWLEGDGWVLRVSDDGNNFIFQKERNASLTPLAHEARPSKARIFAQGMETATSLLADLVKLGPREELVEMGIQYEKTAGQASGGGIDPTVIAGWTAVFGRAVDGNLVVGGGSHVAVSFDSSGAVEALDVDWPEYADTGETATAATLDVVKRRGRDKESPVMKNEARLETKMECGYLDLGGRHATKRIERLQLGCMRTLDSRNMSLAPGNSEQWGEIQAIPAAVNPIAEAALDRPAAVSCDSPTGCR